MTGMPVEAASVGSGGLLDSGQVEVWPGQPYPLGATYDGIGTNFTLFSEVAERVELCLFDDCGGSERRVDMPEVDGYVWHRFLPGHRPRAALRLPRARAA